MTLTPERLTLAPERTSSPSAPAEADADPTTAGPAIGRSVDRVDGLAKTTGTARFSAEYPLPGLTHAVLVHSPIARGRIRSIDVAQAEAHPGVVLVLTHHNAPRLTPPPTRLNPMDLSSMAAGSSIAFLNTDEVHVDGQPVAAVVAETLEAAQYAASLVRVDYETLTPTADFDAELANSTPVRSMPVLPPTGGKRGDARAAYATSPVQVDLTFTTPQHNHNALEPHATTAVWDDERLTVHEGCQNIDWTQKFLAKRFDIPAGDVHVVSPFVGGAFGGKSKVWAATLIACMAAKVAQRPVRLALTREGVYRTVGGRTPTRQRVAIGASTTGRMEALIHSVTSRKGRVGGEADQVVACSLDLYDAATILAEQRIVELDLMSNTAMRAPGEAQGSFAVESAVDELAVALAVDPVELRLLNQPGDKSPVHGTRYSHRRLAQTLEQGRDLFGWADRPEPCSRDGKDLVGWGVAAAIHPAWEFVANVRLTVDRGRRCSPAPSTRWGWGPRQWSASWSRTVSVCRSSGSAPSTATPTCPSAPAPVVPVRRRAWRRRSRRPATPCASGWTTWRPRRVCRAARTQPRCWPARGRARSPSRWARTPVRRRCGGRCGSCPRWCWTAGAG